MKKTLVVGASPKSERYSFKAVSRLRENEHPVVAFGNRTGQIADVQIGTEFPNDKDFDTVSLYLSAKNQDQYTDKIIALNPKRVIFNPGTENPDVYEKYSAAGIQTEEACTLVLLSIQEY